MTIKNVSKIPTTYRAVQWTGNEEEEIRDLMDGTSGYSYVSNDEPDYAYLYLYDKKGNGVERHLRKYEWVVVSSKGKVEVLDDDDYKEKYQEEK